MKYLNYKQLAFILGITPIRALEKIISIHCKINGLPTPEPQEKANDYLFNYSEKDGKKVKIRNSTPDTMSIDKLSEHLNIPALHDSVNDIRENYLKRPASKKYILADYPEKQLEKKLKNKVKMPVALKSLLKPELIKEIHAHWFERYGINSKS